jgi:phosphatidylserine decarboxylase
MVDADLTHYENLGQFFYRQIQLDRFRTIDPKAALVSPSDGKVLHFGRVEGDEIEQVKGVTYSLNALLGPHPKSKSPQDHYLPKKGNDLFFAVVYLAPGDYHRFHSPVEWKVDIMRHFAGEMFSVNPGLVAKLQHLFSLNERVSILGSWKYGFFSMVPVAATNVGRIILNFAPVSLFFLFLSIS